MDHTLYKITILFNLFIEHMFFFFDELFQKHTLIDSFEFLVSLSCMFSWFCSLTYCMVYSFGIYFLLKVVIFFFVYVVHEINIATISNVNVVDKRRSCLEKLMNGKTYLNGIVIVYWLIIQNILLYCWFYPCCRIIMIVIN
jgi:hypothetical protein